MCFSRWLISALVILATSFTVNAKIYTTPILADANDLLQTSPDKSLEMTQRYLEQRRLSNPQELSRVHVNDETDHTIRTPLNTINALQIKARAYSLLNQPEAAIKTVKEAEKLAKDNNLSFTTFETRLIHARIYWDNLKNSAVALNMLDQIDKDIEGAEALKLTKQVKVLQYQSLLQRAIIESHQNNENKAEKLFTRAKRYLVNLDDNNELINYQLTIGHHYLLHRHFDLALDRLLSGYWLAVEQENNAQIAIANYELANLFEQRKVFDKALEHATQAGEFFEHFNRTLPLAKTLALIASIYEQQGRYNLALVHYFNALDQENQLKHDIRSARLRLNIARVYLQLYNYPKTEQYLQHTRQLAKQSGNEAIQAEAQILQGKLELAEGRAEKAVSTLQAGLIASSRLGDLDLQLMGESELSNAFEQQNDYYNALLSQRRYEQLFSSKQEDQVKSNVEVFKQQQRMLERSLQLEEMERQQFENEKALYKQKNVTIFLLTFILLTLIVLLRRHRVAKMLQARLMRLRTEFYTHPRSGLRNLRMLNARLPNSLQQSSANFEQWHLGEIINEPLSDRLRFALLEVPFLKHIYLEHGYQQGLELERQFGEYLKEQVCEPARLYHFSDAMFLYIEPNSRLDTEPNQLANSIQQLVDNFLGQRNIDHRVRIGMAEYPFLPRAYTAINDHELLDILLMAANAARLISKTEPGSQWVHLSAIDAAPAASFASDNIRKACLQGIDNGLVKVQSSSNTEINWNNDHDFDKNII
ncbi:tetratricopeptide repeat protein [Photobacterium sp. SDRW27]|uniref:tetratricopeptide repeat-containing diguanylate cyclase n=1 Tax=Photobacterium obscurum TaxID=2829490 RepID=UPI002243BBB8|nr:tetratricopeptide repeat protein [Photobacterium obscurum]MCW8331318.1 tetratricopeptide repeat protein [Photobacterium obscurum]